MGFSSSNPPKTKIKVFYFPISEDPLEEEQAIRFFRDLCGLQFVTESAISGTLDEVINTLRQSNYSFSAKKY